MLSDYAFSVKRKRPASARIADVALSDLVLYTHAHYDHFDIPTLKGLKRDISVVLPWNTSDLARKAGKKKIIELKPWQNTTVDGITITATKVKHWGARNVIDEWRGYLGYVIETREGNVFIAGDTGYGRHFKDIAEKFSIDVAVLPIGAYRPFFFRINHMSPKDAVKAFHDLKAKLMIPVHWGAFRLSLEKIDDPIKDLLPLINGLPVKILQPGEAIEYNR
jgi:L-ascorbate metabolism protein UlaG (beta-lactamase superfamily)